MGEWLGVLIAIVSSCLGGTAAAVTRYLVGNADPLTLAILRWGIGFLCVLPVALVLRVRWPPRGDWPGVAGLGLLLLRAVLHSLQHRGRLHDGGARQPRAVDLAAADHAGRRAARHRAADAAQDGSASASPCSACSPRWRRVLPAAPPAPGAAS